MAILAQVSSVVAVTPSIVYGGNAVFDIYTINIPPGSIANYRIYGVSASEVGIPLQGTFVVGSYASANNPVATRIYIPTNPQLGATTSETLTLGVTYQYSHSASETLIPDTSKPTYIVQTSSYPFQLGLSVFFGVFSSVSVPDGTKVNYTISGISPSDLVGGQTTGTLTLTGNIGSIYIQTIAHSTFIGDETITFTVNGASATATLLDKAPLALAPIATYKLEQLSTSVFEGGNANFNVTTQNVPSGTALNFTISGVSTGDLVSGQLSGNVVVDSTGRATISIPTVVHQFNQGNKTLTVTLNGISASEVLIDLAPPPPPTYKITSSSSLVTEGNAFQLNLATTNLAANSNVQYAIAGVDKADLDGVELVGLLKIDANGLATLNLKTLLHPTNHGNKNLTFTVADASLSVALLDPSPSVIQDVYDGKFLTIPKVSVAGINYNNVVVSLGNVLSVGGGYANALFDSYEFATNHLNISSVNAFGNVFNNVIITVGTVVSINGVLLG